MPRIDADTESVFALGLTIGIGWLLTLVLVLALCRACAVGDAAHQR